MLLHKVLVELVLKAQEFKKYMLICGEGFLLNVKFRFNIFRQLHTKDDETRIFKAYKRKFTVEYLIYSI